jgi:hypothetical protein
LLTVALPCIYILKAQTSDSEPLAFLTFTVWTKRIYRSNLTNLTFLQEYYCLYKNKLL